MFKSRKADVSISIARAALDAIFDECDRFDRDETGGRLIGTYRRLGERYDLQVSGVLGPGPNARRSPTSFFQDGEYQEELFRAIEKRYPEIEHLGSWHTHHVNGYPTLSGGDKATYHRTVNHAQHNTDFFYALLVVRKNSGRDPRYEVKHYFLRRNDDQVYEIPAMKVRVIDAPTIPPTPATTSVDGGSSERHSSDTPNPERARDQEFFAEFYPGLKALFSKNLSAMYWKGALPLIDGSETNIVAMEEPSNGGPSYSIAATGELSACAEIVEKYKERRFRSARQAVLQLERDINRALYRSRRG